MFDERVLIADMDASFAESAQQPGMGSGGAETPKVTRNADQRALLKVVEDPAVEKHTCFGGKLLMRQDGTDNRIFSFVVEGMTPEELAVMKQAYQRLYRSGLPRLISRADPFVEQVEQYTAFNFECQPGSVSLREYCKPAKNQITAETMMRKLLRVLIDWNNQFVRRESEYESLNCLSLDTLFVDVQGQLWLLPLRAFRNCFPREIAPEAHDPTQKCDETSDLCAAAYVALEVENHGQIGADLYVNDSKIKDCLMLIPQCRPRLKTMVELFGGQGCTVELGAAVPAAAKDGRERPRFDFGFADRCKDVLMRIVQALRSMFTAEERAQVNKTCKPGGVRRRIRTIKQIDEIDEERL